MRFFSYDNDDDKHGETDYRDTAFDITRGFDELTQDGDEPFLVGNGGRFNSPYEADDKEDKYE